MDDDDEIARALAEFGIFLPPLADDGEDDALPPRLDDWDDFGDFR